MTTGLKEDRLNQSMPAARDAQLGTTLVALITGFKDLITAMGDGLLAQGTLAVGTAAEKFQTTTQAVYRLAGVQLVKAATDALTFSAAYTINNAQEVGTFWGAFTVQVNDAGAISTKAVAADQAYATEADALAAAPAADTGKVALGTITVETKADIRWTANTDDLTADSDCTVGHYHDADTLTLPTPVAPIE